MLIIFSISKIGKFNNIKKYVTVLKNTFKPNYNLIIIDL